MILITPNTMDEIQEFFASRPDFARLHVQGEGTLDVAIYKVERNGNMVYIWTRIPTGIWTVTKVQIINKDGGVMLERNAPIMKPESRNVYTRFEFEIVEVAAQ